MSLEYVLLGMLSEPASGYDLRKSFDESARHFWSAELSQIYPALKRMTARGWLRCDTAPSRRGPERQVYRRTQEGVAALKDWLRTDPLDGRERIPYIAQLIFLGEFDDPAATDRFLETLYTQMQTKLELLEEFLTEMLKDVEGDSGRFDYAQFHDYMSLRMGVAAYASRARCCEENLELFRSRFMEVAHRD